MTTTFQKPENALRSAEQLIDVGNKQDALKVLLSAIQNKKFRNLWTITTEKIMMKLLELCVELKKMRDARDGLYQYRTMCQAANLSSLQDVVQKFRKLAEEKVNEAKAQKEADLAKIGDLDEMEPPQTIMLKAIQANDTRQQSQDRDVHSHFRFLWDTYKVVLDVLKSNVRLEEVYHETARNAFEFCRINRRPGEFRKLCDTLRKNYLELSKNPGKVPAHQVDPNRADSLGRTLETRCKQLQIATELDLWRESHTTATEICDLMNKCRPKPHLRSMYYEYLGQIFWKSENHLFHAFACLKNLMFVKASKSTITKEELSLLASKAVLSTLCVPFQQHSDIHASLELTTEGASSPYEKAKKNAALFNTQTVPSRDSISQNLTEKGLLSLALEPVQKLYALIESDFTPLSLCQDAGPFLDEISNGNLFDDKLVEYITPLKQIIFFRLMKQLSEVYANMTINNFERAASIVPFSIAEKWMASAARQHGINIQINYSHKAIVFGAPRKVDMKSMRQPLIEIGHKLQQAMQRVAPEEQHKKEKQEKATLANSIVRRNEEETKLFRQRKDEIEKRKEELEKRKDQQEREQLRKQKQQEELEQKVEQERLKAERIKREEEREESKRKEDEAKKNKEMLEEMQRQAETSKSSNLKIEGKKIKEIDAAAMGHMDPAKIMAARQAQIHRERQEKIRQRKLESKRVDHLARACREEEHQYVDKEKKRVEKEDTEYLEAAEKMNFAEQQKKHEESLVERNMLSPFQVQVEDWVESKLQQRREEHDEKLEARKKRVFAMVVANKIERAKTRHKEWLEKQDEQERRLEAERVKRDQEKREEEERKEQAKRDEERLEREKIEQEEAEERAKEEEAEKARKKAEREEKRAERARQDEEDREKERQREDRRKAEKEEGGWGEVRRGGGRDDRGGQGGRDDRGGQGGRDDRGGQSNRNDRDDRGAWRPPARADDRDAPRRDDRDDRRRDDRDAPRRDDRDDRRWDDRDAPRRDDRDDRRRDDNRDGDRRDDRGGDRRDDRQKFAGRGTDDGGSWRRPQESRDSPKDEDNWRSGPRAQPARRDDRDDQRDDRRDDRGGGGGRDDRGGGGGRDDNWGRGGGGNDARRSSGGRADDDGDNWRSGPRAQPARRDDRDDNRGGDREERRPAWGRADTGGRDERRDDDRGGDRGGDRSDRFGGGGDRGGGDRGGADRAAPAQRRSQGDDDRGAPPRKEPERRPAAAAEPERRAAKPAPEPEKKEAPKKEEPPAEDDGFETVGKKKKGKK